MFFPAVRCRNACSRLLVRSNLSTPLSRARYNVPACEQRISIQARTTTTRISTTHHQASLKVHGDPLSPPEREEFNIEIMKLADTNPEVARTLLHQLEPMLLENASEMSLTQLHKVVGAKLQKKEGRGKTHFFAYLSSVDKNRVLELTGAEGAAEVIAKKVGRTTFFAHLPGAVKFQGLHKWQEERQEESGDSEVKDVPPPMSELVKVALSQGVPMIGFGFADNFLMICFGESIDAQFGLYVSTMAAAGLGNLSSNIVGLGLADRIEQASGKLGVPAPELTERQRDRTSARLAGFLGTAGGVTIGCLLGMVPLFFWPSHDSDDKKD